MTVDTQALSLFQQILLATDGTVTDLVALYTGEQIRVRKLDQQIGIAQPPAMLACAGPTPLLTRRILLCGPQRAYLYAESVFIHDRLPRIIQQQLLESDRPIGLLWKEQRLETYREIVDRVIGESAEVAQLFGLEATARLVSRTYVIHHGGKPLGAITEKWPLLYFR